MLLVWVLTVPTATKRSLAISLFERPEARRVRTSSSRSLRGSTRDSGVAPDDPFAVELLAGDDASREGSCSSGRSFLKRVYSRTPFWLRTRICPFAASLSSILDASSTVSEVRMAAVAGGGSPPPPPAARTSLPL